VDKTPERKRIGSSDAPESTKLEWKSPHAMVMSLFFEIIKFYMLLFATYIEWTAKEGGIDGD
jgi:hypothetical protein